MSPVGYLDGPGGRFEELHHASPRIVGTPLSSGSVGSNVRPGASVIKTFLSSSTIVWQHKLECCPWQTCLALYT
jgi:hypothetical protein